MAFNKKIEMTNKISRSNTTTIFNRQGLHDVVGINTNRPKSSISVDPNSFRQDSYTNLSQNLLSALECPVCMEYMAPPITLCENGHNICPNCKPHLDSCPTCRCPLIGIRNVTLENIAREVNLPCPNNSFGCTCTSQLNEMATHLSACNFRLYDCIFYKPVNCSWKGQQNKITDHVLRYHKQRLLQTGCLLNCKRFQFEISNAECFKDCSLAIIVFDEIFLYHRRFDIENKKLCMAVQYIGLQENTSKFQMVFKLSKNNGNQKINISSEAKNIKDDVDYIFLSGECVTIHFDMLMSFTKGKKHVVLKKMC